MADERIASMYVIQLRQQWTKAIHRNLTADSQQRIRKYIQNEQ